MEKWEQKNRTHFNVNVPYQRHFIIMLHPFSDISNTITTIIIVILIVAMAFL